MILSCSYQPSSLIHVTSNPSIFSLLPSSWIQIILNSPFPKLPTFSLSPPPIIPFTDSHCPPINSPSLLLLLLSSFVSLPLSSSTSRSAPPSLQDFWQVWGVCRAACVHLNEATALCILYQLPPSHCPPLLSSFLSFYYSLSHCSVVTRGA